MIKTFAYSSLFTALAVMSASVFYSELLAQFVDIKRLLIIGLASFASYNFVQVIPLIKNAPHDYRSLWINQNKIKLSTLSFLAIIFVAILSQSLSLIDLLNFSHLAILVFFYESFRKTDLSIRKLPYIKAFIIAYVWTMVCVFPNYYDNYHMPSIIYLLEFFLFIFSLTLAFDLRDIHIDKKLKIKTLATHLGFFKTKLIIISLFYLSCTLLFIGTDFSKFNFLIYVFLSTLILFFISKKRNELYYFYFIDGLIPLKLLLFWNFGQ